MSALMIEDLSVTEELDSKEMKTVRGGSLAFPYFPGFPSTFLSFDASKHVDAQQMIQQQMNFSNVSGNNNAFAENLPTTIKPTMTANNTVNVR